jgi:hypothetical protein
MPPRLVSGGGVVSGKKMAAVLAVLRDESEIHSPEIATIAKECRGEVTSLEGPVRGLAPDVARRTIKITAPNSAAAGKVFLRLTQAKGVERATTAPKHGL